MSISVKPRLLVATMLALSVLAATPGASLPAAAAPAHAPTASGPDAGRLVIPGRGPSFLLAVNYEGPADWAWQMWEDGRFDPALIAADLRRARDAGFSTVRVFVQEPLARDAMANRWDKLDRFLALADQHGLSVILAFYDYGERDLDRVAEVNGRIAARYASSNTILAYDLKNEPHFSDLAAARYPAGAQPPIRSNGSSDEALKGYQEMLARAGDWVTERKYLVSTLDYLDSPEGRQWDGLMSRINGSLEMWLRPQIEAIRRADPKRPITLAYSDIVLAKLPANNALDYVTVHRYPNANGRAVEGVGRLMSNLRSTFGNKPVLLGEFGFSTEGMSPEESANHEIALYLQMLSEGLAGGAKWMLNDYPQGFNPRQNAYGAFRGDGSAKPVVAAVRGLAGYLAGSPSPGGHLYILDRPAPGYRWLYEADDAFIVSSSEYRGTRLSFKAERLSQLFLTWADPRVMRIYSTSPMELEMDPGTMVRDGKMGGDFSLSRMDGAGKVAAPFSREGNRLKMVLEGERWYELALPRSEGATPPRGMDYEIPGGRFFTQANGRPLGSAGTGFAVTDEGGVRFWSEFGRLGGPTAVGYPVTGRFVLDGFVTQAFQKGVLQWRPEANQAYFLNTFDLMHDRGLDGWLLSYRQTPLPFDSAPDTGLPWEQVAGRHLAFLDGYPAIKERFLANPDWLRQYGLPVAHADMGNSIVVRAQRATFQYWKEDVPWAKKGEVSVANGGDLAKEAYVWPVEAATPQAPPSR